VLVDCRISPTDGSHHQFLDLEEFSVLKDISRDKFEKAGQIEEVKGTVSRDFSSSVFFIKQLLLVPRGMPRNDFEFF
jgi:hypothetical protein